MKKLLLLFLAFVSVKTSGQELPQNLFETRIVKANYLDRQYVDAILAEMKTTKSGSLKEASYFNMLCDLYPSLGMRDSSRYYRKKLIDYWTDRTITDDNRDFYGQYLLAYSPLTHLVNQSNIDYMDSAAKFIQNPIDKSYIEYGRWATTNIYDSKDQYIAGLNNFLGRDDLLDEIRGKVLIMHARNLMITDYTDSAMSVLTQMDELELSMQIGISYRNYRVGLLLAAGDFYEARKDAIRMRELLREDAKKSTLVTIYNATMEALFKKSQQYDSAAYYVLNSIEVLKSYGLDHVLGPQYDHLAGIYSSQGDYSKAEKYEELAFNSLPKNALGAKAQTLNSLLSILLKAYIATTQAEEQSRILSKAEETVAKQESIISNVNSLQLLTDFKIAKGRYLTMSSQLRVAEAILKESLTTAESQGFSNSVAKANLFLGELYLAQGKYKSTTETTQRFFSYEDAAVADQIRAHEVLIEAYIAQGLTKKALTEFKTIKDIEDQVTKQKTDFLLTQYEVQQELISQKLINQNLESEQLAITKLIGRQQLIIIISTVSVLIITFILFRLRHLHRNNLVLLQEVENEGVELQNTNTELEDTIVNLQESQQGGQELLGQLSIHLNKIFNGLKGLKGFIPEVGRLNNEQSRYFNRMSDLLEEEQQSLNGLISLNSIFGNHKIDIRRVSLSDAVSVVKKGMLNSLRLNKTNLEIEMPDDLIFLADRELIEMSLVSLIQHSLQQELVDKKLKLKLAADEGLHIVLAFKSESVPKETIDKWLVDSQGNNKGYLSKLSQLKDLMDGWIQYLCIGDLHKITVKLNLIELKPTDGKGLELDELEIDQLYEKVMNFLVEEDGLSDSDLTLGNLSATLGLWSRKISFAINTREKTNFSKFLSRLRVEKVRAILDAGNHSHLNIAGIGYEAGFNSKSTFFSSFKEFVGCTPKEYMLLQKRHES